MKVGAAFNPVCTTLKVLSLRHCPTTVGQNIQLLGEKTDFDVTVEQCLIVSLRIAHARFLSDTVHCPMVTSKYVVRRCVMVPDGGL